MHTQLRSMPTASIAAGALAVVGIVSLALVVSAGGSPVAPASPTISVTGLNSPSPTLAVDPSEVPSAGPSAPAPKPTAKPSAKPSAKPAQLAAWSKPARVKGLDGCWPVVAAIDDDGSRHLAASCASPDGGQVRYAVSTDSRTWKITAWKPPASRLEVDPQLAFSGKTLYLAWTRQAPAEGGCGDDGLDDVGVYYRTRTLPNGAWSKAIRIGKIADHLESFRVNGAVLHATVLNEKDGTTAYETGTAGTIARYPIGDSAGGSSVRVGDDGKARIAYESTRGISYGMVKGRLISSEVIPNSRNGWAPSLTLAPNNIAYVMFTRSYHGVGCIDAGPFPEDGTYVATNASGTWVSRRLTPLVGGTMTLDPVTGELHAVVGDGKRIVYFHRLPGGDWAHETAIRTTASPSLIREDPRSHALFMALIVWPEEGDPWVEVAERP
jgi:hypothetical protein